MKKTRHLQKRIYFPAGLGSPGSPSGYHSSMTGAFHSAGTGCGSPSCLHHPGTFPFHGFSPAQYQSKEYLNSFMSGMMLSQELPAHSSQVKERAEAISSSHMVRTGHMGRQIRGHTGSSARRSTFLYSGLQVLSSTSKGLALPRQQITGASPQNVHGQERTWLQVFYLPRGNPAAGKQGTAPPAPEKAPGYLHGRITPFPAPIVLRLLAEHPGQETGEEKQAPLPTGSAHEHVPRFAGNHKGWRNTDCLAEMPIQEKREEVAHRRGRA